MIFATSPPLTAAMFTPPPSQALINRHGRTFDYPGMVIPARCNLLCLYGLPEDGVRLVAAHKLLRTNEILPVIAEGANFFGSVRKRMIRLGA